jgi:hypothetical protein
MPRLVRLIVVALVTGFMPFIAAEQDQDAAYDRLLDTYVRDGRVMYKALQTERAVLAGYVRTLDVPAATLAARPAAARKAFWLNAYNALVLQTVVTSYPIRGNSALYPRNSIRQIPGSFERLTHRVAGESLTLDAIEQRMLRDFGDARIVLAIGRGAIGSGRLRSEAYTADRVEAQLQEAVAECAAHLSCVTFSRETKTITVTPMVGWRTEAFEQAFVAAAGNRWPMRSAIERAIAAMLLPVVLPSERDFLMEDTFRLTYGEFDWSLNEL